MFFLNISTEHKEYCDNFYMTVHNVKNLQIIKYTIVYTHLWRAKRAENLAMASETRIEAEAQIPMSDIEENCDKLGSQTSDQLSKAQLRGKLKLLEDLSRKKLF